MRSNTQLNGTSLLLCLQHGFWMLHPNSSIISGNVLASIYSTERGKQGIYGQQGICLPQPAALSISPIACRYKNCLGIAVNTFYHKIPHPSSAHDPDPTESVGDLKDTEKKILKWGCREEGGWMRDEGNDGTHSPSLGVIGGIEKPCLGM